MQIARFDPFNELFAIQNAVERTLGNGQRRRQAPPRMELDAWETEEELVIKATVPGATRESINVSYEDDFLTIEAEVLSDETVEGARYHLRERTSGKTSRTLRLPFKVVAEDAKAHYKDGVVHLTLPKAANAKKTTITIE